MKCLYLSTLLSLACLCSPISGEAQSGNRWGNNQDYKRMEQYKRQQRQPRGRRYDYETGDSQDIPLLDINKMKDPYGRDTSRSRRDEGRSIWDDQLEGSVVERGRAPRYPDGPGGTTGVLGTMEWEDMHPGK